MRENRAGGITLLDFKIRYKTTVIQKKKHRTAKDRHIDRKNRIESSEINPHTYGHLIFNKGANIQ